MSRIRYTAQEDHLYATRYGRFASLLIGDRVKVVRSSAWPENVFPGVWRVVAKSPRADSLDVKLVLESDPDGPESPCWVHMQRIETVR